MNKLIGILYILAFMTNACDTDCNDCGPTGYTRFYMVNSTNEPKMVTWFKTSGITHEFSITEGEKVLLYEGSVGLSTPPILEEAISVPPFGNAYPYDSVRIASVSDTIIYTSNNCELTGNPLCEENYELIKSVDTRNQKIKEWEIEIE